MQTDTYMIDKKTDDVNILSKTDSYTQTEELEATHSSNEKSVQDAKYLKSTPWNIQSNGEIKKSIAEQVKEVAQSALQETGMVYVESAGMYYDYKTGYYYNSVSIKPHKEYFHGYIISTYLKGLTFK